MAPVSASSRSDGKSRRAPVRVRCWCTGMPRPCTTRPANLAATLTGAWIVLVTAVLQGLGWLVAEILIEAELGTPFWLWPAVNLANAFLSLLQATLLTVLPQTPTIRAIGRLWPAAAAALAV